MSSVEEGVREIINVLGSCTPPPPRRLELVEVVVKEAWREPARECRLYPQGGASGGADPWAGSPMASSG